MAEEKLYYIQSGWSGNAMLWWRPDCKGYTENIEEAGRYPAERMLNIINNRPEIDVAWECDYIDNTEEIRKVIIGGSQINYSNRIEGKRQP